jgi:LPPG:FO 2-phospho-L-lactate transferase
MPAAKQSTTKIEKSAPQTQRALTLETLRVVLLAGGVGGAKLAHGLAAQLPPQNLTIIVNTGDDFQHWGLTICPDLDTVVYTLAELANPETGWGRANESWRVLDEVKRLGGPDWFRLGDLDLALHLSRNHALVNGVSLTEFTRQLCQQLGVGPAVLPMSDRPSPTFIETADGLLPFQDWFVRRQWQPAVRAVQLPEDSRATYQVLRALEQADVVIFAPSNPFVSIDPILNVYPIRSMITDLPELTLAVSPIIAGQALKGPAAKMMQEMDMPVTAVAIADYYHHLIDAFIYDRQDHVEWPDPTFPHCRLNTIMQTPADRSRFAGELLQFALELLHE